MSLLIDWWFNSWLCSLKKGRASLDSRYNEIRRSTYMYLEDGGSHSKDAIQRLPYIQQNHLLMPEQLHKVPLYLTGTSVFQYPRADVEYHGHPMPHTKLWWDWHAPSTKGCYIEGRQATLFHQLWKLSTNHSAVMLLCLLPAMQFPHWIFLIARSLRKWLMEKLLAQCMVVC